MSRIGENQGGQTLFSEWAVRLGQMYRHLQREHHGSGPGGALRRALEERMNVIRHQFETLLSEWIPDGALRREWMLHFYEGGPPPEAPAPTPRPQFKGVTVAGTQVEVRSSDDGAYDVIVDGSIERHEPVPWHLDPEMLPPYDIAGHRCSEIFDVEPEALQALAWSQSTSGAEPPWRWARELYEDGIVDAHFALTPRGRRALRSTGAEEEPVVATHGVLVADAARARVLLLRVKGGAHTPTLASLTEVGQSTRPQRRMRPSEQLADTRPGIRRGTRRGAEHGVDDHRRAHTQEEDRRFATQIVEDTVRLWRAHGVTRAIVAASPSMLGHLRAAFQRHGGHSPWSISELGRDLVRLTAPALHDALARSRLLPPRRRLPPMRPIPGRPS